MTSLFDLSQELQLILSEEKTDQELIQVVQELLVSKIDSVASFRQSIDDQMDRIDSAIKQLKERKEFYEKKSERFDSYVLTCLNVSEKKSLNGDIYKISKRKSQSVEIYDEDNIPLDFIKIPEAKPQIMKAEISKALKAGEIIEGARIVEKETVQYKLI